MAQPTWALQPEGETGESPILHRRAVACRPSSAGQWQGAGDDVDEEHSHTMRGSDLRPWRKRRSSEQARDGEGLDGEEDVDGGTDNGSSTTAWGQRATGCSCGPSHCRCGAAGGWMKSVDDELSWRKLVVGKSIQPKSLAVGLGSKTVLCVQEGVAGVIDNLDDDEGLRWWWLTVSMGRVTSVTKGGAKRRWRWGGKEMGEVFFDLPTREDNLVDPCGAAIGRQRTGPAKQWVARS
jgi:hypothetical protein